MAAHLLLFHVVVAALGGVATFLALPFRRQFLWCLPLLLRRLLRWMFRPWAFLLLWVLMCVGMPTVQMPCKGRFSLMVPLLDVDLCSLLQRFHPCYLQFLPVLMRARGEAVGVHCRLAV